MTKKNLILFTLVTFTIITVFASGTAEGFSSEKEQFICFGAEIDGNWQSELNCSSQRFTINNDGTVTDNLLNLMWDQNGNQQGIQTWSQAICYCCELSTGGYCDWRLPTENEIESLMSAREADSLFVLNGQSYSFAKLKHHWTSTSYSPTTTIDRYVILPNGYVYLYDKRNSYSVMAVRSVL